MKRLFLATLLPTVLILNACTYNISMAHTEGTATDVIDDTASNQPDVSPTLSVPASVL